MAFTKTVVVAVLAVAVFAQLSAASCSCGCGSSGSYGSGSGSSYGSDSYGSGSYGSDSYGSGSYGSDSYGSGSSGSDSYGASSGAAPSAPVDDSWTNIPSNAIVTNSEAANDCAYKEIRMPDYAAPAVAIVRPAAAPCCQHLSYDIEVPATQETRFVPSYHSASIEVPVQARAPSTSFGPLPYSVEVPVGQQEECRKLSPLNVEIAVPVRERQVDTRLHSSYTVEVPAEERLATRLTNLRANVDRVVLPAQEYCCPPNNGPAPVQQVQYVAVPAAGPCPSPTGLLGLGSTSSFNYNVPTGSSSGSRYVEDDDDEDDDDDDDEEEKKCDEEEETTVVRAGCFYTEPEEAGRHRRRRDVDDVEAQAGEAEAGEVDGEGEAGESVGEVETGEGTAEVDEEKKDETVEEEQVGEEKGEELQEEEEVAQEAQGVEDAALDPELAAEGADGEDGDAAALNKRMCNSQSLSRSGGRACSTSIRLAEGCQRGGPTKYNLNTYYEDVDDAPRRASQSSTCACSGGQQRETVPRAGGSRCSIWRPTSSSSSRSSPSSCSGSARGARRQRQRQGQCECGARSRQSCSCGQGSRTSQRRAAGSACRGRGGQGGDESLVITPYLIPETQVRELIENGGCDCDCPSCGQRGQRWPSSRGRASPQSSRIVNSEPYCSSGRILRPEEDYDYDGEDYDGDYEDDAGREYEDDAEDVAEDRTGPATTCSCNCGCDCRVRRRGHHDLVRAAQRAYRKNIACVGERTVLVHNSDTGLSPLNRDCLRVDDGRDLPSSSCAGGSRPRELEAPCSSGAARDLPESCNSCGAARDLPSSSCSCGAARELPSSSSTCGATRELQPSTCGTARDLPSTLCTCNAARDPPSTSCTCNAARDLPSTSCTCGTARDPPSTSCTCGAARDPPSTSCTCGAAATPTCDSASGSPTFMCPICGKGLRAEHLDHICKCITEQRDLARAADPCGRCEEPCRAANTLEVAPQAIMIPIPILRSAPMTCQTSVRADPCPTSVRADPCPTSVRADPCPASVRVAPACESDARSGQGAEVGSAWVKEWINEINRALSKSQQQPCFTCGAPCSDSCYCRGQRSLKPDDVPPKEELEVEAEIRGSAEAREKEEVVEEAKEGAEVVSEERDQLMESR